MSRGAQPASASILEEPGPIRDGDVPCHDCRAVDAEAGVYRVRDPRYSISTVVALCPYHLRAFASEEPLTWEWHRDHPEYGDPEAFAAGEEVLVERSDVPDELPIDGTLYERVGLDEAGRAYFAAEVGDGAWRVIETDEEFTVQESTRVERERLRGLLDHVEERVGWRGLEGEWIDRANEVMEA